MASQAPLFMQNGAEWISWLQKKIAFLLLLLLMLSTILLLSVWYSSHSFTFTAKEALSKNSLVTDHLKQILLPQKTYDGAASSDFPDGNSSFTIDESCDISIGKWARETRGPVYSSLTCSFIPETNNCQKYGKPPGYLNWRWKPDGCDLPRFEPKRFLDLVRGKKLAFLGDSIARNQFESLLCLLSQADTAIQVEGNSTIMYRTMHFQSSNFTLMIMWSEYYVQAVPHTNCDALLDCFDLYLDKINMNWTSLLPGLDFLVISGGNWYFRKNYLYENDELIGCTNCNEENLKDYGTLYAIRSALRKALESINSCQSCRGLKTFVRTYSSAHFDYGAWYNGGDCNIGDPLNEIEKNFYGQPEVAKIQNEEVERIKNLNVVDNDNRKFFGVLDVTDAMVRRADAHPGGYYNKRRKIANDCLHWCLPGPVDMWNEMLMLNLIKTSSLN